MKKFYGEGLDCPIDKSFGSFASFKLGDGSSTLGLYKRKALAKDAGVSADGTGFRGFTLSHTVISNEQVDQLVAQAAHAGGTIAKPAQAASSVLQRLPRRSRRQPLEGGSARLIVCTPAGFEREFARRAAAAAGVEPPSWAMQPIPEVTRFGPRIGEPEHQGRTPSGER